MSSAESAARFLAMVAKRQVEVEDEVTAVVVVPVVVTPKPRKPPDRRPRHERMSITREQILALRAGAEAKRDRLFAGVCDRALRDDTDAVNACKAALYGLA